MSASCHIFFASFSCRPYACAQQMLTLFHIPEPKVRGILSLLLLPLPHSYLCLTFSFYNEEVHIVLALTHGVWPTQHCSSRDNRVKMDLTTYHLFNLTTLAICLISPHLPSAQSYHTYHLLNLATLSICSISPHFPSVQSHYTYSTICSII